MCFEQEAAETTFRARIHATDGSADIASIVENLREWVSSEPILRVGGVLLRVDFTCDVALESLSSGECGVSIASFPHITTPPGNRVCLHTLLPV